jgi:hypothetical protein
VIIAALALAGIYSIGYFRPSALNWGFHALGFLPWQFFILYLVVLAAILISITRGNIENIVAALARSMERTPVRFFMISTAIVIAGAILFRIHIPLLGDGFYLVKNYSEAFRGAAPLYPRDEPLATYYFAAVFSALGIPTYEEFLNAFLIADLLLAVGFMINVFIIARTIFTDPYSRLLTFMIVLVLPYMQLFFGYVETYGAVLFALSFWINVSVLYLHKRISFFILPGAFLIMALTHYLTVLTLPSLLLLTFLEFKNNGPKRLIVGFGIALGIILSLLVMIQFNVEQFSSQVPYSHILSFSKSSDVLENYAQAYTMFSSYHAIDLLNIAILMCPFILVLFVLMPGRFMTSMTTQPLTQFLFCASMPVMAFLCIVKFDLGAARDWDVFSSYVFILVILVIFLLIGKTKTLPVKTMSIIILVSLLHSSLYWYMNSTTGAALKRYGSLFDSRLLSQNGFYGASLQLSLYYHQINEPREPVVIWKKYASLFPNDERGYTNIINNLNEGADDAGILNTYQQWRSNNPNDTTLNGDFSGFCLSAGKRFFDSKKYLDAEQCFRSAIALDSVHPKPLNNLGSVLAVQGKLGDAMNMFEKALALDSTYTDALYNLGSANIDAGKKKEGRTYLQRAARLGNKQAQLDLQQQKLSW